ncbi:MAG: FeoB-associated Cys-rich membrane protein [Thermodesulfovibrionales bacterium]
MGLKDVLLMALIIGGAVYLLYRSIWKNKGHCSGCGSETCNLKKTKGGCS